MITGMGHFIPDYLRNKNYMRMTVFASLFLVASIWFYISARSVEAQSDSLSISSQIIPSNGYLIGVPFSLEITVDCPTECPEALLLQLDSNVEFVDLISSSQPVRTSLDFDARQVILTPLNGTSELMAEIRLIVQTPPITQPIIQLGVSSDGEIDWIETISLFEQPIQADTEQSDSELPNIESLYFQNRLERLNNNQLSLNIAPANLGSSSLENVKLITTLPKGVSLRELSTGRFVVSDPSQPAPNFVVRYQTASSDDWIEWGDLSTLGIDGENRLIPPSRPDQEPSEGENIDEDGVLIQAIQIEIASMPAGFRWAPEASHQLQLLLEVDPTLTADWIEICTTGSGQNREEIQSCDRVRARVTTELSNNLNLKVISNLNQTEFDSSAPLELIPELHSSLNISSSLDLIVELPSWLSFEGVKNDLTYTLTTGTDEGGTAAQPTFDERLAIDTGREIVSWHWEPSLPIDELPLPIIVARLEEGVPVGAQTIPMYVLSDGLDSCWGDRPSGRDFRDLDGDDDRHEFVCKTEVQIRVQSFAGIGANLLVGSTSYPGIPFTADLVISNLGNQPITQLTTVMRIPTGWLTAPPELPTGLSLATSSSNNLCNGKISCGSANWQFGSPINLENVTAIRINGSIPPLQANESLSIRLHLQSPLNIPPDQPLEWPSLLVQGGTQSEETVEYRYQPEPINLDNEPTALTSGRVFLDNNQNGQFDDNEPPLKGILVALVNPGGDSEPGTADDLIINWSRSEQDGIYQFSNGLPALYYLATLPNKAGLEPILFTGDLEEADDNASRFDPNTWRTETFNQFQNVSDTSFHLGLTPTDLQFVSGLIALDQNQNSTWDDPISAGLNHVLIELIDETGQTVSQSLSQSDAFGRPGRFRLPIPSENEPAEFSIRVISPTPLVSGEQIEDEQFELILPIEPNIEPVLLVAQPTQGFDSGDAPLSYGTPFHGRTNSLTLGLISDSDLPAIHENFNDAPLGNDDATERDDEDGVFFVKNGLLTTSDKTGEVIIVARNRQDEMQSLHSWIDFDTDGTFSEDEKIIDNYQLHPRINPHGLRFEFNLPDTINCGQSFARFRLGGSGASMPEGIDTIGEVEDVPLEIKCVTDLEVKMEPESTPIGPNELSRWFVYLKNLGDSPAENVKLNISIPGPFNYQGLVSMTNDPIACTDLNTARTQQTIECQMSELAPGQEITLNLSYFLPFDTEARSIESIVSVTAETEDANLNNNLATQNVKVEKNWILKNPTYEAFAHVSLFPGIIDNPDNREADFHQQTIIPTAINVPISIAIGVDTNRQPILTVQACIDNPEDPTCNGTNFIEGQVIQQDYGIERIFFEDELVYEPETVQVVRLNRISDPNMARCGALGSCVGFDLFRVGRGDNLPYAWNAPADYFQLAFYTSGGILAGCNEEFEERCFIQNDARPGNYDVEGFATLNLVFQDTRLGPDPVIIERTINFRNRIRVVAPFVEPER